MWPKSGRRETRTNIPQMRPLRARAPSRSPARPSPQVPVSSAPPESHLGADRANTSYVKCKRRQAGRLRAVRHQPPAGAPNPPSGSAQQRRWRSRRRATEGAPTAARCTEKISVLYRKNGRVTCGKEFEWVSGRRTTHLSEERWSSSSHWASVWWAQYRRTGRSALLGNIRSDAGSRCWEVHAEHTAPRLGGSVAPSESEVQPRMVSSSGSSWGAASDGGTPTASVATPSRQRCAAASSRSAASIEGETPKGSPRVSYFFQVRKRVAVFLREHLVGDFLAPPTQASLTASDQSQNHQSRQLLRSRRACPCLSASCFL